MTKSLKVIGKTAQEKHDAIVHLKKIMSMAFLTIGRELREMKVNDYWQHIMGEDSSWVEYCKEVGFNRNYADLLIRLYEQFIIKLKFSEQEISEIDQRKLIAILPHSETRKDAEVLLEDARVLSRQDLLLKMHQIKNDPQKCGHQDIEEVHYWYCKICREKLSPEEVKKAKHG